MGKGYLEEIWDIQEEIKDVYRWPQEEEDQTYQLTNNRYDNIGSLKPKRKLFCVLRINRQIEKDRFELK